MAVMRGQSDDALPPTEPAHEKLDRSRCNLPLEKHLPGRKGSMIAVLILQMCSSSHHCSKFTGQRTVETVELSGGQH
eukprot:8425524-Pyramimonas_sp.AAC.1